MPWRLRSSAPGSTSATIFAPLACTARATADPMKPAAPVMTTRAPGSMGTGPVTGAAGGSITRPLCATPAGNGTDDADHANRVIGTGRIPGLAVEPQGEGGLGRGLGQPVL